MKKIIFISVFILLSISLLAEEYIKTPIILINNYSEEMKKLILEKKELEKNSKLKGKLVINEKNEIVQEGLKDKGEIVFKVFSNNTNVNEDKVSRYYSLALEYKKRSLKKKQLKYGVGISISRELQLENGSGINVLEDGNTKYYDGIGFFQMPVYILLQYNLFNISKKINPYTFVKLGYPYIYQIDKNRSGGDIAGTYYYSIGIGTDIGEKIEIELDYSFSKIASDEFERNISQNEKIIDSWESISGIRIGIGYKF